MKTIELKSTKETIDGKEIDLNTKDLIRAAVKNTPPGGFAVEDIINRMRILGVLDKAEGETLELEDSDFQNLGRYVKETRWSILSETIVDFSKQFV